MISLFTYAPQYLGGDIPHSGAPISVSPLTWSHATYVSTVCQLRDKRRALLRGEGEETDSNSLRADGRKAKKLTIQAA